MWRSEVNHGCCFLRTFQFVFWDRLLLRPGSCWYGWLVRKPQESACLCFLSIGFISMSTVSNFFQVCALRIKAGSPFLYGKRVYHLNRLSRPHLPLKNMYLLLLLLGCCRTLYFGDINPWSNLCFASNFHSLPCCFVFHELLPLQSRSLKVSHSSVFLVLALFSGLGSHYHILCAIF